MIILGIVFIVGAFVAASVALGLVAVPDKAVRARMQTTATTTDAAPARRMRQLDRLRSADERVMTSGAQSRLRRSLVLAGHPAPWSMRNIALAKVVLPVAIFVLVLRFMILADGLVLNVMGIAAVVVAYFVPDLLIHSRGVERQEQIQRELPDALDKIVIAIEAGLAFEAALAKTARGGRGPLADELVRTLQDISLGVARRDAYEALQKRTSSEDLVAFIRGVIQAEEHGSSMSQMVRIQSKEMRMKRKLRAEAKAGKVSVKLLGPLMVCIFPVLFIVVLSPGVINAFSLF